MQTNFETLSPLERRLTMAVPVDTIDREVEERLRKLSRTVRMPGFRPGKVPVKLVTQQYGPQVRSDVISESVKTTFADAIREQNLRVAGYPRIEPRADAGDPGQLEFSATFEVYPEIRLGDLSTVTIERPQVEVGPEDVRRTIDMLRKQRTRYEGVARAAAAGDRAIVDFSGAIDGVAVPGGQANDFAIVLGEGRMLPEFEAAVAGMREGESKSFALTFPADYHGREVAGKVAEFTLTVKGVAAALLPDVDVEFAKALGIASGDVADLETEIADNLRLELKRKIEAKVKEQVFGALREKAEFVLPKSLVELEAQNMLQRMAADLRQQGMKPEDIKLSPEMFRTGAEGRVAVGLVVGEIVRAQGLAAKPEQVRALVQEAAQTYEQPEAVVRWHYEKGERLNDFETLEVEHNVMEWVLGQAQVQDKPTLFTELMGTPAA
jgi:trigger factor